MEVKIQQSCNPNSNTKLKYNTGLNSKLLQIEFKYNIGLISM